MMKKIIALIALKKILVIALLVATVLQQNPAQSQALPVAPAANFVVNRAIGGVLTKTAISRGFAANDPRIATTLAGASSSLTAVNVASTVGGVALGIAGAPVWLTVAASVGIFAVGAAIVAGKTSLKLSDNLLIVDSNGITTPPAYAPGQIQEGQYKTAVANGLRVYRSSTCFASDFCGQFPLAPAGEIPISRDAGNGLILAFYSLDEFTQKYHLLVNAQQSGQVHSWAQPPAYEISANGSRRLVGLERIEYVCTQTSPYYCGDNAKPPATSPYKSDQGAGLNISASEGPRAYPDLNTAYGGMSAAAKNQPLPDNLIANLANQAWQNAAAQPGYQGLPYSVTQPITATDVAAWRAVEPAAAPTIADLLSPANAPGSVTVPISPTVTVTNPSTDPVTNPTPTPSPGTSTANVNVMNAPKVDLGADPQTPDPTLETTPTAWQILSPIMSLIPELKNYRTPSHASECPKPTFQIFGETIAMESHCAISEQFRSQITSVMSLVWILVALFIVLSA
ncbi:hypothetical protein [Undibacterium danionis]|uniref:Uncharacterized protein n=1 Tax=Undibacterium danionis TaxID=1812100 RepID=A0ABV6IC58_9BURK